MNRLLGIIIKYIYDLCGGNYGLAIILFTLLIRIILLPLGIKQQKAMAKTQKLQPLLASLQKKYKNDKERLNQETMKLYQKYNINPLGGCLPLLLQLPILFSLIQVIYNPAKYILNLGDISRTEGISKAVEAGMNFNFLGIDLAAVPKNFGLPPQNIIDYKYWIIPILATIATYVSGVIVQKMSATTAPKPQNGEPETAMQMNKSMTTMMPIMTLVFTYTMPGTAALYWFISSATQTIQQLFLNKRVKVDDIDIQ